MKKLVRIRRVTVIVDAVLESTLIKECMKLGAPGYTCINCRGKRPEHLIEGSDPFTDELPFVRIEMLVAPDVADRIVEYVNGRIFRGWAHTACVETVKVSPVPTG